jgi:ribokinase
MTKILVIGSSNTDMIVKTERFPLPGETILGGNFFMFPGGKGANQAVAAARLGAEVCFICKVGGDIFGQKALEGFLNEKIDTQYCIKAPDLASGVALIIVNEAGENEIVVASGANNHLTKSDIDDSQAAITESEIILLQLETPIETVEYAINKVAKAGKKVVLNPAPAQSIALEVYKSLFLITPNETEAQILTGIPVYDLESADNAAQELLNKGVQNVIITMGSKGAFFKNAIEKIFVPAQTVKAIDTTAAGDVFNGALVVGISRGLGWQEAIEFANAAAAISVTRMGAQASAPYLTELN